MIYDAKFNDGFIVLEFIDTNNKNNVIELNVRPGHIIYFHENHEGSTEIGITNGGEFIIPLPKDEVKKLIKCITIK